jgi:heavy metal sensor kinase
MRTGSIRFRLTAWYAGLLTAVVLALTGILFLHLKSYLEGTLLETQQRRARQIADTLISQIAATGEGSIGGEIATYYVPEKSDRFIRVTSRDGTVIYVSGPPNSHAFDPAAVPPAPAVAQGEFTRKQPMPGGAALLIAAVRAPAAAGGAYLIEVGTSAEPVEAMFRHLLAVLGLGLPLVVALAAAGGYALVRRALRPVEEIAGRAERITQHNLGERLPVPQTGDELERLSTALNHMITRLDDAFRNSKRFVADASHELRTPLTVLFGELENLAQEDGLLDDHQERLGSLLEEVERLSKIVDRLFALSRLDAGEAQSEWVRFDLAALAAATADQMALLAEDRRIAVVCEAGAPVMVEGDRARLKQVVVNLLDNAIKYTPEGGSVRMSVKADSGKAVLEVADTGIGLAPDDLARVFDRFFRADKARSRDPDGAGLGLAIVKSICNAHGGRIEVESTLGTGSCFRVALPKAADRPTTSESKPFAAES